VVKHGSALSKLAWPPTMRNLASPTPPRRRRSSETRLAQVGFKNVKLKLPAGKLPFTAGALQAKGGSDSLMIADADVWRRTCGDEVVTQIVQGAALYFTLKLQYATQEEKEKFSAEFSVSGPLFEAAGKVRTASEFLSKRASVEVSAYQLGGDVAALNKAFNVKATMGGGPSEEGAPQYQALSILSLDNPKAITSLLDSLVSYATTSFPEQIRQTGVSSVNGPADLGFLTEPYTNFGLSVAPPMLTDAWKERRRHLGTLFEELITYSTRADSLLHADLHGAIHLSRRQRVKLQALRTDFSKALTAAADAAMICYTNVEKSPQAVEQFETSLNDPATGVYRRGNFDPEADFEVELETFRQWFDLRGKPSTLKTVDKTLTGVAFKVGGKFLGFDSNRANENYGLEEGVDPGVLLEEHVAE
jgi:hypothetical protein